MLSGRSRVSLFLIFILLFQLTFSPTLYAEPKITAAAEAPAEVDGLLPEPTETEAVADSNKTIPAEMRDSFDLEPLDETKTDPMPLDSSTEALLEKVPEVARGNQEWLAENEALIEPLVNGYVKMVEEAERVQEREGHEALLDRIDKDELVLSIVGFGKGEVKLVDGIPFVRLVDEKTEIAYILVDTSEVSDKSRHLEQIIARQHLEAGRDRKDRKIGRKVVLVWMDHKSLVGGEERPKPFPASPRWWKEYYLAKYKKPTFEDVKMGMIFGILQASETAFISYCQMKSTGGPFNWVSPLLGFVFGSFIGTMVGTYKNITTKPDFDVTKAFQGTTLREKAKGITPWMSRASKASVVSIAFAASNTQMMRHFIEHTATLAFIPLVFDIGPNVLINNLTKDFWNRIGTVRNFTRENARQVKVRVWGKTLLTLNQSNLENQLINMFPYTLKVLDLMNITSMTVLFSGHAIKLPLLLLATLPIAQAVSLKLLERLATRKSHDEGVPFKKQQEILLLAQRARRKWEWTPWGMISTATKNQRHAVMREVKGIGQETYRIVAPWFGRTSCLDLMDGF